MYCSIYVPLSSQSIVPFSYIDLPLRVPIFFFGDFLRIPN